MSSRINAATAVSGDELFQVEFWREEFKSLVSPIGRQWKQKIKEIDPGLDCNTLDLVRDGRAKLEKTRRVVVALRKIEVDKTDKSAHIASKIKRHKLTIR